jgi:hypothetical protein
MTSKRFTPAARTATTISVAFGVGIGASLSAMARFDGPFAK